jgi:hypothetical protein
MEPIFAELLADHDRADTAGIVDNLLGRRHEGVPHDVNAGLLIVVDKLASDGMASKRAKPPAAQDALFNGRTAYVGRAADTVEFNQLRETGGPP